MRGESARRLQEGPRLECGKMLRPIEENVSLHTPKCSWVSAFGTAQPAGGSGSGSPQALDKRNGMRPAYSRGVAHGARPFLIEPGFLCTKARSAQEGGLRSSLELS